ncbi:DUF6807 family protein [Pseudarthrobacter sp. efr-133-R2A-89]|jgi:LacI family transcriptional regulator|uniref:DUF6807 family protein n=1 Tax=Pseudarthrobacter sp. efr-133-R2A-89 TaxID=3040302 RepID=UPI0010655ED4|nr:DUF6807 family protein [Pseudarthrobacter sp. efr-133-R2A-89]
MTSTLRLAEFEVATYEEGTNMPRHLSPRPYLQARTTGGIAVTQLFAPDHAHHVGVSAALPDVNGVSFWGGRTFVREVGSVMLDNHGVQAVVERRKSDDTIDELIEWVAPDSTVLLREKRTLVLRQANAGWRLDWRSTLSACGDDVTFGSPHTNGKEGAFYGGLFWRTPFVYADFVTTDGEGIQNAHGSTSPWLAVITDVATLVAWNPSGFPWFARDEDYVGFCPAIAVHGRRCLPVNEDLVLEMRVAVCDGRANPEWLMAAIDDLARPAPDKSSI